MADSKDHLDLPHVEDSFKRKKRRGGPISKVDRNYQDFATREISKLDKISAKFHSELQNIPDYNQELVFKIKTSQKVADENFREDLRRAQIDTLISKPGKNAEWIVIAQDPNFSKLKEKITKRIEKENSDFVDGIETFNEINPEDKYGPLLKARPLGRIEVTKLTISLTRKENDVNDQKLNSAINLIQNLVTKSGYGLHDKLNMPNLCMLLIESNANLLTQILQIDLVTKADRTPEFHFEKFLEEGKKVDLNVKSPKKDATGILIMDSGIIKHPLLDPAMKEEGIVGLRDRIRDDDRRHGTMVSGNALYGNIEAKLENGKFSPESWIYSAKIFYQSGSDTIQDENRLIQSIIKESLDEIKKKFPNCRVVNLSFGDESKVMGDTQSQFDLAVLIDELAIEYPDTIFVISMGNIRDLKFKHEEFPHYLCNGNEDIRLVDPASSIHALSVGALQEDSNNNIIPSDITRTGPGLNEMIKPELVELGGGFHKRLVVLNDDFRQRTFTINSGTSFSAPIISNYISSLINKYPKYSRNLIIALLLSSSKLPDPLPEPFPKLISTISNPKFLQISNVYGYGKPTIENALSSFEDRVVFKHEGEIIIDHTNYFTIKIPKEFVEEKGNKFLSISLVFDPPIRSSRLDYFGTRMEFHLFRNRTVEEVQQKYSELDISEDDNNTDGKVPEDLKKDEIKFKPSSLLRKKTPHQKGFVKLSSRYKIDPNKPLTLAVICQKKWEMPDDTKQKFAVVVTIEHEKEIELYSKLRNLNVIRTEVRPRVQIR